MDELSALFFEVPGEDGIQLVADDDISSHSDQPREYFQEKQGALLSDGALGLGEVAYLASYRLRAGTVEMQGL